MPAHSCPPEQQWRKEKSILFKSLLLPVWFWQTFLCRGSRSSGPDPALAGSPLFVQGGHIYSPPAPLEHHLSLSPSWSAPCKRRRCEAVKGQLQNSAHQFLCSKFDSYPSLLLNALCWAFRKMWMTTAHKWVNSKTGHFWKWKLNILLLFKCSYLQNNLNYDNLY